MNESVINTPVNPGLEGALLHLPALLLHPLLLHPLHAHRLFDLAEIVDAQLGAADVSRYRLAVLVYLHLDKAGLTAGAFGRVGCIGKGKRRRASLSVGLSVLNRKFMAVLKSSWESSICRISISSRSGRMIGRIRGSILSLSMSLQSIFPLLFPARCSKMRRKAAVLRF